MWAGAESSYRGIHGVDEFEVSGFPSHDEEWLGILGSRTQSLCWTRSWGCESTNSLEACRLCPKCCESLQWTGWLPNWAAKLIFGMKMDFLQVCCILVCCLSLVRPWAALPSPRGTWFLSGKLFSCEIVPVWCQKGSKLSWVAWSWGHVIQYGLGFVLENGADPLYGWN